MLRFPAGCCNERVFAAQRSPRRRRALMNALLTYAYRFPRTVLPEMDEDTPGEFILYCHDKLVLLVDEFEDRGVPFEHYANSVLRWQIRSYVRDRTRHERRWENTLYNLTWDGRESLARAQHSADPARHVTRNDPPRSYPKFPTATAAATKPYTGALRLADRDRPFDADRGRGRGRAAPARRSRARRFRMPKEVQQRRMLFALLKTAHLLDTRQFDLLVRATGCHADSVLRLLSRLERFRQPAITRCDYLRERRNQAFADYHLTARAMYHEPGTPAHLRAVAREQRARRTLARSQSELARVRVAPSNRHIAVILGIPKGTVDTGLYLLRRADAPR